MLNSPRIKRVGLLALLVPRAPPAQAFLLLVAQQPMGRFSSNLAHVCSRSGENV